MRGEEQEKVTVICTEREREELYFPLERSLAKDSHSHDEWFLAFDFKENHQEESEMMFDKNGRQEEISSHYKKGS